MSDKNVLQEENQRLVRQLKSLFATYNEQKSAFENVRTKITETESEKNRLSRQVSELEKECHTLRTELGREVEQRKDTVDKYSVCKMSDKSVEGNWNLVREKGKRGCEQNVGRRAPET